MHRVKGSKNDVFAKKSKSVENYPHFKYAAKINYFHDF